MDNGRQIMDIMVEEFAPMEFCEMTGSFGTMTMGMVRVETIDFPSTLEGDDE